MGPCSIKSIAKIGPISWHMTVSPIWSMYLNNRTRSTFSNLLRPLRIAFARNSAIVSYPIAFYAGISEYMFCVVIGFC